MSFPDAVPPLSVFRKVACGIMPASWNNSPGWRSGRGFTAVLGPVPAGGFTGAGAVAMGEGPFANAIVVVGCVAGR
jgi:hypothetical protein